MIISTTTFYVILAVLIIALFILASKLKKKGQKKSFWNLLILLAFPVYMFTPHLYTVTACGEYNSEMVLFPKGDYTWGRSCYIVNNSDSNLLLEYIPYGEVDDIPDDIIIRPGETHQASKMEVDYPFRDSPSSVRVKKKKGTIKTRLICYDGSLEEEE
ncbi:MAG: hypothetical protein LUH22_09465 [Bacteroides sp.]|nr:hypothetical protein [Bacteroides sp.]